MVTNARSPGAKCYGIVTMSSSTEVARCIAHLHRTELHGQQISVEKVGLVRCKVYPNRPSWTKICINIFAFEKNVGERRSLQKGAEEGK